MKQPDWSTFDYKKIAELETAMWRAYYNHQFFKLFVLTMRLIRTQLGLNWLLTIRVAYYAAWAAAYYRINKYRGVDSARVLKNLTQFYRLIALHWGHSFDYAKAAQLELAWWDIHRRSTTNNKALEQSLAANAAVVYTVPSQKLTAYAHNRAEAMMLPAHEGDVRPVPTDWPKVNRLLTKSWHALYLAIQQRQVT